MLPALNPAMRCNEQECKMNSKAILPDPSRQTILSLSKIMNLTRKKKQARAADQLRVERGEITRDELQAKNSIIPMELANDPEWRAKRLAAAAASMNRPRPKLKIPASLLRTKNT